MDTALADKRGRLEEGLARLGRVLVAYSGGVDSTLLMAVAHEVLGPERTLAVTAVSPSLAAHELEAAGALARRMGWSHETVTTHEVSREEYARNAPDRCYWCKTELFEVLGPRASAFGAPIALGTNTDDLSDHRPGLRAAREHSSVAPLVDAGLSKAEVRALSAELGLPTADKPASPCLSSRFAYGVRVTEEGLRRVERAEAHVRSFGFVELRVRDHGEVARVEVARADIPRAVALREQLSAGLLALGYRTVTIDPEGFRSGSLNEVLAPPRLSARRA